MLKRLAAMTLALALPCLPAHAADPFQNAVKDCQPCRFSPGPGQPDLDITFVFQGSGDDRTLAGLKIVPVGGGGAQTLAVNIAASDFPDGFTLGDPDLNFDGYRDLSIVTQLAANNETDAYWVYRPKSRTFTALERVGDDGGDYALTPEPKTHLLYAHIHGSAIEHTDYWYRVDGARAVAVRREDQAQDGKGAIVSTVTDLTVKPGRVVHRDIVGFMGDSPARDAFLKAFATASRKAAALYRSGDKAGALKVLDVAMGPKYPDALGLQDGSPADHRLAAELNDYGFYMEENGRHEAAIDVLQAVIDLDSDRTVAYLNLADAEYATGEKGSAKANYLEYRKRMTAAKLAAKIPPRVAERVN